MNQEQQKLSMKPLAELTLLDRFLFACAMEEAENLQLVLQIILGKELELSYSPHVERELRTAPWLRSVRLDVVTMDEAEIYNTEVQRKNTGNLRKRSRFYQALVDSSLLAPGEINFNRMPSATLITIAPFDLFKEGRYRYTFRMKCEESENLWLEDGATRIFLNTHGKNSNEVSEELVELLHYFENTTEAAASQCKSERVKALHRQIVKIKSAEEIGVRYMQEWEEKQYFKEEGREEGRLEGERAKLKELTAKKLAKGKTAAVIAEELEEEIPVIEEIIQELREPL